jgi:hypothetical protein
MTKSNFDKLNQMPLYARPPRAGEGSSPLKGYGAMRAGDGRTARKTGRTVQFATVVSEEFKHWIKVRAAARGKSMAALLDDMKAANICCGYGKYCFDPCGFSAPQGLFAVTHQ